MDTLRSGQGQGQGPAGSAPALAPVRHLAGPTPGPGPTPAVPGCRNQVRVLSFVARPAPGLNHRVVGNPPHQPSFLSLSTGQRIHPSPNPALDPQQGTQQGITFEARIELQSGKDKSGKDTIPVDDIHIRYIQNVRNLSGLIDYKPNPDLHMALVTRPGGPECPSRPPILDLFGRNPPPLPFYLPPSFRETPPTGSQRTVTVADSPSILDTLISNSISTNPLLNPHLAPGAQMQKVDVTLEYRMYLGCFTGNNHLTFQTLATLDWWVHFYGRLNGGPPWTFDPGGGAGITSKESITSQKFPDRTDGPTYNQCIGWK